jgi:hypothetical protein
LQKCNLAWHPGTQCQHYSPSAEGVCTPWTLRVIGVYSLVPLYPRIYKCIKIFKLGGKGAEEILLKEICVKKILPFIQFELSSPVLFYLLTVLFVLFSTYFLTFITGIVVIF